MPEWERASAGTKTVYGKIGIWRRPDGQIGIRIGSGAGEISTVAADPRRERGNPHLYSKLRDVLIRLERWPEGPDGIPVE
jgi:hypothetical protein